MPLVYRAMRPDNSTPMIGHDANDTLGVRERVLGNDGKEQGDIQAVNGQVLPGTGGMSVSPSKGDLPGHLIPKRLRKHGYPDARRSSGRAETFPWRMGSGDFTDGPLGAGVQFRIDPADPVHGFVEPDQQMALQDYRAAIEATQPDWLQEQW